MGVEPPIIFVLHNLRELGGAVCDTLGIEPAPHEEVDYDEGEHKARPLLTVRGRDVVVLAALSADAAHSANDQLCRLAFFIGALRDAGAARITAIPPYLCYARKDRRSQPRDPITTRYVAGFLESMGLSRLITIEVHNLAAYENAFRCLTEHVEVRYLFAEHLAERFPDQSLVVASPDTGGIKRADRLREALSRITGRDVGSAVVEKHRSGHALRGELVIGEVDGRTVIIMDDLISSGGTMQRAARAFHERGAIRVIAAAAHGLFRPEALAEPHEGFFADNAIDEIIVSNTVTPARFGMSLSPRLTVLDAAPLIARAIRRIHPGVNGSSNCRSGEGDD